MLAKARTSLFFLFGVLASWGVSAQGKPVNIVFILADDLGYGEVGCYGQEKIKTPHLDRLATQGMRFTQHYSGAPVCAPARCTLLTGRNLARAEIRGNKDSGNGRVFPGQWPLTAETLTLAEVLKTSGYATGGFGKWGLGPIDSEGSPLKQGFDRFYGYNCQRNAHSFFPLFLNDDEKEVIVNPYPIPGHDRKPEGEVRAADYRASNYAPDLILAKALQFLDQNKDRPFFLYLPFVEPHVAMQPPQEWIDRYPAEWDKETSGGKGVYRGQNGYLPHDRPRAAYAAMISHLDHHVGEVMKRLDTHGLTENTLVIFTSDNGTTHPGKDLQFHIGGCDAVFFNSTAGLRGYKGSCYEGGIRVPCLVRWPGKTPAGSVSNLVSYFPDWFSTLIAIAGAQVPEGHQLDGIDLSPVIKGETETVRRRDPLVWEFQNYGGIIAIRDGKWKVLRRDLLNRQGMTPWELYDLESDPGETTDLAAGHPDLVKRLESFWLGSRTIEPDFPLPSVDRKMELP